VRGRTRSGRTDDDVGSNAAKLLGLDAKPDFDEFKSLLAGVRSAHLRAAHGETPRRTNLVLGSHGEHPQGVTVALENGDKRIHDALWKAGSETMADIEE
jgi:hypothetical protein